MAHGDERMAPGCGTYALVLHLDRKVEISVGKLGDFRFPGGYYCYVGSARGPGGIDARVARHLRRHKRPHWHIDYLLSHTRVLGVWAARSTARLECTWARALLQIPGAQVCVHGFGSSDCGCDTHLVYCSAPRSARALSRYLNALGAVHWLVNRTEGEPAHE